MFNILIGVPFSLQCYIFVILLNLRRPNKTHLCLLSWFIVPTKQVRVFSLKLLNLNELLDKRITCHEPTNCKPTKLRGFGVNIPARILKYSDSVLAQSPAVLTGCFVVFLSFVLKILEKYHMGHAHFLFILLFSSPRISLPFAA